MNIKNSHATLRIENLFVDYHALLDKHVLTWLLEINQKIEVQHDINSIKLAKIRKRLEIDLEFSHNRLKKDLPEFFAHTRRVSVEFLLIDGFSLNEESSSRNVEKTNANNKDDNSLKKSSGSSRSKDQICLSVPKKSNGIRHRLRDCCQCLDAEKKVLFEGLYR